MSSSASELNSSPSLPQVEPSLLAQARLAVSRADVAVQSWRVLTLAERYAKLKAACRRLLERRDDIVSVVQAELGKVAADALFTEALGPLDNLAGVKRAVEAAPAGKISLNPLAFPKKSARIELVPRGVIGVIAPWNFPVAGLYRAVFPALLLGNAVVVKSSENSPRSTALFVQILAEFLPENLLQVLAGSGGLGAALIEAGINACVFTGSTKTGAEVEARCARAGVHVSVELGGNDGAIVLNDCELPRTVAGITHFALQNAGQSCGAVEVVYADSRIAPALVSRLADAFQRLRRERESDPGSIAPLGTDAQAELVKAQLADALAKGAELVCGGQFEGRYLAPTLLTKCTSEMRVVSEESFGPILPVVEVDGPMDAVRRINEGAYGLTASIWTQDFEHAERLAGLLDVGVVTINNHGLTGAMAELPWSGRRASGSGIANSAWSLLSFAQPKTILVDRASGPETYWMPFDQDLLELGQLLSEAQLGRVTRAYKIPLLLKRRISTLKAFFGIR